MKKLILIGYCFYSGTLFAQTLQNNPNSNHGNRFEPLGTLLPTPNEYRTASGAPGPKYWQQKCNYDIKCELDEQKLRLSGTETITYINNSPDPLVYLWLQLDENEHSSDRNANYQKSGSFKSIVSDRAVDSVERQTAKNDYGVNITKLTDAFGKPLKYTVNKTMMRVELHTALKPGQKFIFKIDWNYHITERAVKNGRGGYEFFPEDGNYIFIISQWYPRLCVYSDFQGWENHQFTGNTEFALTFGDFNVQVTVPADYVVGATGQCQNYQQVLSPGCFARWQKVQTTKEPLEIVTLEEAKAAEKNKNTHKKTWIFKADNVRDFAIGTSRKFIWDAMPVTIEGKKIMCMSYYGKQSYTLYKKFSTKMVAHTIKTYSHFTIPYPYPVAQSVEAASGMEYPMICFNYGRTAKDGTYSEATKWAMLGVIVHEVGHNFFPMIVNSDERQWAWMDEGINTFVEYLTEQLFDNKFPSRRGPAYLIADYMKLPKDQLDPIMTNAENIVQLGSNAYGKPTAGLNILRETIMGREQFDYAFKEYARRWAFHHPTPADFFRTMQDASGESLDWFWRGWFYGTDPVDISLDSVKWLKADIQNPPQKIDSIRMQAIARPQVPRFDDISRVRNREDKNLQFLTDADTSLRDFYWKYDRGIVPYDSTKYEQHVVRYGETLPDSTQKRIADKNIYELQFSNKGGMVMPIIIEWTYKDGSHEIERIPAQVWRLNENTVKKVFVKDKEVASIRLDPMRETADIDENNNAWPKTIEPSRFQLFKERQRELRAISNENNPMQKAAEKEKKAF